MSLQSAKSKLLGEASRGQDFAKVDRTRRKSLRLQMPIATSLSQSGAFSKAPKAQATCSVRDGERNRKFRLLSVPKQPPNNSLLLG